MNLHSTPATREVNHNADIDVHVAPVTLSDQVAFAFVKLLRFFADTFFAKRYGHRAVVLETVAAVPGMVGGLWQHLKALRYMRDDEGWIRTLLDEALAVDEPVGVHPLRNTATLTLKGTDILAATRSWGHEPRVVDLPKLAGDARC